ncbi:hypothetical protein [uncultured Oscillibacter sp.]|uniref:hypothetical protein n=1 Tax=uncultured Oscillibacter sp. TaxID=876091 RepID=UPI002620BF9F|nr:hypothetical protein [uncultured Oscillibacter sp.]
MAAADAGRLAKKGFDLDSSQWVSSYRYVLLACPENERGYILSLDAGCFSVEELLEFAASSQY